jgi:para-aminobenzoate synthetase
MERAQSTIRQSTDMSSADCSSPAQPTVVGFFGYFGYELKHEVLAHCRTDLSADEADRPDAQFAFANGVLSFDHATGIWTASALLRNPGFADDDPLEGLVSYRFGFDEAECQRWFDTIDTYFRDAPSTTPPVASGTIPFVCDRTPETYKSLVDEARSFIADGESYELCLTTQFRHSLPPRSQDFLTPSDVDHFPLYLSLRARNPAPYSAYLRFAPSDVTILCTSPERFMRIDRDGNVEMKPIKGTVRRHPTSESADAALRDALEGSAKEQAESLMIVDLIRNELSSFCRPSSVDVAKLAKIETYETVHQLVSTIRGTLSEGVSPIEALRRCFPPGEFQGARFTCIVLN